MSVLVDTSVWSLGLRRKQQNSLEVDKLKKLILEGLVQIIGPIRQELLSGIKEDKHFEYLQIELRNFPDIPINTNDYEKAASFFNQCRKEGIQGSHIDFLICAVAHTHNFSIFTTDKDFTSYQKVLPIQLFK